MPMAWLACMIYLPSIDNYLCSYNENQAFAFERESERERSQNFEVSGEFESVILLFTTFSMFASFEKFC